MPDMATNQDPNACCSDCGTRPGRIMYWGDGVPPNTPGTFCPICLEIRSNRREHQKPILPIGQTTYKQRAVGKYVFLSFYPDQISPETGKTMNATTELTKEMATMLGVKIGHPPVRYTFAFYWSTDLDEDKIDAGLNALRAKYTLLAVTTTDQH